MTPNKLSSLFVAFAVAGFPGVAQDVGDPSIITAGKNLADRILPFLNYNSSDQEDFWDWMQAYQGETGGDMFDSITLTAEYAMLRQKWEPLYEVNQIKGDGEPHPTLSSTDEFSGFEAWDKGSFGTAKGPNMIAREFAREALKQGLSYEENLGVNPFKFGLIGSSDTHTSLVIAAEGNFFGKATPAEPSTNPKRFKEMLTGFLSDPEGPDYIIRHYTGWDFTKDEVGLWDLAHAGDTHEKAFGTAWSDDRKIGADGKFPPAGNTIDVASTSFSNLIGEPTLFAHWTDPDFNPAQRAFYYVRVLEISTPRGTTYDAKCL